MSSYDPNEFFFEAKLAALKVAALCAIAVGLYAVAKFVGFSERIAIAAFILTITGGIMYSAVAYAWRKWRA